MSSNFVFAQLTLPFLEVGGQVEIVEFGSVPQTLESIANGATFLSLIPWFGFQLIDAGRDRSMRPNRLRSCEVGGDRVPSGYFQSFADVFGIWPREHLGMAETNTTVVNPMVAGDFRLGSVGTPLPEVEVEVRGADRESLPGGAEGEIWIRTPAAMSCYWRDPEATQAVMEAGWVATGDAGYLDDDGYLWYTGRIKQIILCDGDNIHPGEVEREIAEHPRVNQVCVVGVPDERRGEVVAAAVTLDPPGSTLSLDELADFLGDRLTSVKIPRSLLVLDHLPQTPASKVDWDAIVEALGVR